MLNFFGSIVVNFVIFFLGRLPRCLNALFIDGIVAVVMICAKKEVNQLFKNIERLHGLPRHSIFAKDFAKQCLGHQVAAALESLQEILIGNRVQIEGFGEYEDFIQKYKADQKGLIIITGHMGSWELMAKYTSEAFKGKLSVLAKPARQEFLTHALDKLRQKMGTRVLWTSSKRLLRDMLGVIKDHQALGFVMDQKPANRIGLRADFLGHPAEFVNGPAQIAKKMGCPVVAGFCMRLGPNHYRLIYFEVSRDPAALTEEELTRQMVATLETMVKRFPEQWTWNYKRWLFDLV